MCRMLPPVRMGTGGNTHIAKHEPLTTFEVASDRVTALKGGAGTLIGTRVDGHEAVAGG